VEQCVPHQGRLLFCSLVSFDIACDAALPFSSLFLGCDIIPSFFSRFSWARLRANSCAPQLRAFYFMRFSCATSVSKIWIAIGGGTYADAVDRMITTQGQFTLTVTTRDIRPQVLSCASSHSVN
jgi:hypothetical protein